MKFVKVKLQYDACQKVSGALHFRKVFNKYLILDMLFLAFDPENIESKLMLLSKRA